MDDGCWGGVGCDMDENAWMPAGQNFKSYIKYVHFALWDDVELCICICTLMACGKSGSFMSLICCGMFIFLTALTARAGAADRPASCLTSRFWSSILARMSDMFVCRTIPPITSSARM